MLYRARDGKVAVGRSLSAGAALITDRSARAVESFRLPNSQLAGPAGREQAGRDGFLRVADSSNAAAGHKAQQGEGGARVDAPPIAGGIPAGRAPSFFNGYVVLKAYAFPAGLYGANPGTFFVPQGVPRPTGNPGHSTIYDFNTLGCTGSGCGR